MEVKFADTFMPSLKKMIARERWYWKTWDFIRYDFPRFCKNIWWFKKELWDYRWYGSNGSLAFLKRATEMQVKFFEERGNEEKTSAGKKIAKMKRAIVLLENSIDKNHTELAEEQLGKLIHHPWIFDPVEEKPGYSQIRDQDTPEEKEHNSAVYALSRKIQEDEWNELWNIIKGQDFDKFKKTPKKIENDHNKSYDYWQSQFDGSGIRGWWD